MKLTINPKRLFKSKKSPNVTRSDPGSSSSSSSDSSSSKHAKSVHTPTSVLSDHWSDFSSDLYSELVHAFKLIDRNGDGKISKTELESLLRLVGKEKPVSQDELAMMVNEVDRDGDGCISFEEFGAIRSAFKPANDETEIRETFDIFDTDCNGKITAEELFNVFSSIGDERCTLEDCKRMIRGVDNNGDGFVCFEDFTRMMDQKRS